MSAENRYTPLHYATMKNFPNGLKFLYQAGGNVHVNAREEAATGEEPLLITVVKYNSCDAAKFLLSIITGLNPDYQDNDGLTALHYAVEFANLQVTDMLVSKGAPVDGQDNWKQTPLHCAFQTDNTSVLQEILRVYQSLKTEDIYIYIYIYIRYALFLPTSNARQDLTIHLVSYGGHTDVVKWIF